MEIEQTVNKRKKITRLLLILLMILLSLGCIKYLISKSKKYISENGKSSMGAVVEQIQQTYDLQVSGYYSQLQLVEEFLLHERELSLETDVNKSFFEAWEKESESTPILPDSKQSKIDLNQFINLTRRKDMRKISLKELFYLKSL